MEYFIFVLNKFVNYSEYIEFFHNVLTFLKIPFTKKIWVYYQIIEIIQKIFEFNMESCYKNISNIRNVSWILPNVDFYFNQNVKKKKKSYECLTNLIQTKK